MNRVLRLVINVGKKSRTGSVQPHNPSAFPPTSLLTLQLQLNTTMLFTAFFSLFALAALGQAAPAPAGLETRASKYHCETKYSGTLTGLHGGKYGLPIGLL